MFGKFELEVKIVNYLQNLEVYGYYKQENQRGYGGLYVNLRNLE